jgi:hypothetical protein
MSFSDDGLLRGPYSVWKQSYFGESCLSRDVVGANLASEVELIVRDFFESDEVVVEDITIIVSYAVESCADASFGVYTTVVVVRGYPLGIPKDHLVSWAPSVSSVDHKLRYSEVLLEESQRDTGYILSMGTDIFNEDSTAVYVEQFVRPYSQKTVFRRTICERSSIHDSFSRTREWVPAQQLGSKAARGVSVLCNERKRKMEDGGEYTAKKIKVMDVVSNWMSSYQH